MARKRGELAPTAAERHEDARGVEAAYQRALARQRAERIAALCRGQEPRLSVSAEAAWVSTGRGTPALTERWAR